MPLRFVQNAVRPKNFTTPHRLPRLLERLIPSRARYTGRFFTARHDTFRGTEEDEREDVVTVDAPCSHNALTRPSPEAV
jgi:16S rRNA C967 or C1407 C5-methylase (RsmB/RsmF family)